MHNQKEEKYDNITKEVCDFLVERAKAALDAGHGDESDPAFTGHLMGWMGERCGEVTLGNEWICSDPYVQKDHAEDPSTHLPNPL